MHLVSAVDASAPRGGDSLVLTHAEASNIVGNDVTKPLINALRRFLLRLRSMRKPQGTREFDQTRYLRIKWKGPPHTPAWRAATERRASPRARRSLLFCVRMSACRRRRCREPLRSRSKSPTRGKEIGSPTSGMKPPITEPMIIPSQMDEFLPISTAICHGRLGMQPMKVRFRHHCRAVGGGRLTVRFAPVYVVQSCNCLSESGHSFSSRGAWLDRASDSLTRGITPFDQSGTGQRFAAPANAQSDAWASSLRRPASAHCAIG
jgi:hypothetical protein